MSDSVVQDRISSNAGTSLNDLRPLLRFPVGIFPLGILWLLTLVVHIIATSSLRAEEPDRERITQVSIINALLLGEYDGWITMGQLRKWGDFGLGTCDHLDGELILLDGQPFQVRSDGTVRLLEDDVTTPFASVTWFEADVRRDCPKVRSLRELEHALDAMLPSPERFYALKIEGEFDLLQVRSVPRQERPYRPLAEVAATQPEWELKQIKGTMIGWRSPAWVKGLSVPGDHWHFLSADHQQGGHVLDCRIRSAELSWDECQSWLIELPRAPAQAGTDFSRDLTRELDQVEKQRSSRAADAPQSEKPAAPAN